MSSILKNEEFDNTINSKIQYNESSNGNISNNEIFISKSNLNLPSKNKTFIEILYDAIEMISNNEIQYNKSFEHNKKGIKGLENKLLENSDLQNKLYLTSFEESKNKSSIKSTEKNSEINHKSNLYQKNFNNSKKNQSNNLKYDFNNSENNNSINYQNDFESKSKTIQSNKSNEIKSKNSENNLYGNDFESKSNNTENKKSNDIKSKNSENNKVNDLKSDFKNSENNKSSKTSEKNQQLEFITSEIKSEKNLYENSSKNINSKNKSKMKNKKQKKEQYPKTEIDTTIFFTPKAIEELEGKRELIKESNYKDLIKQKKIEKQLFFEYLEEINQLNKCCLSNKNKNNYVEQMEELKNLYFLKIKLFKKKKDYFEHDYNGVLNRIVKNYRKMGIKKQDREIHEEINTTFNSFFHNNNGILINILNSKIFEEIMNGKIQLEEINNIKIDDLIEFYKLKKCESLEITYIEKELKFLIDYFDIIKNQ